MSKHYKILILTIIHLHFLSLQCNAQLQRPWAPIGAKWTFDNGQVLGSGYSYDIFEVEKDTVFEDITCRKITRTRYYHFNKIVEQKKPIYTYTIDSIKQAMYYNYAFNKFTLLYDFGAQLGDTLTFYFPEIDPQGLDFDTIFKVLVSKIGEVPRMNQITNKMDTVKFWLYTIFDSTARANNKRTYWYLGLLESIGPPHQGFLPQTNMPYPNESPTIYSLCYSDLTRNYNFTSEFDCRGLRLDISDINVVKINVYPTLFVDKLIIENSSIARIVNYQLVNYLGIIVKEETLNEFKNGELININELSSLSKGHYYLIVKTEDGRSYKYKLMK